MVGTYPYPPIWLKWCLVDWVLKRIWKKILFNSGYLPAQILLVSLSSFSKIWILFLYVTELLLCYLILYWENVRCMVNTSSIISPLLYVLHSEEFFNAEFQTEWFYCFLLFLKVRKSIWLKWQSSGNKASKKCIPQSYLPVDYFFFFLLLLFFPKFRGSVCCCNS